VNGRHIGSKSEADCPISTKFCTRNQSLMYT